MHHTGTSCQLNWDATLSTSLIIIIYYLASHNSYALWAAVKWTENFQKAERTEFRCHTDWLWCTLVSYIISRFIDPSIHNDVNDWIGISYIFHR